MSSAAASPEPRPQAGPVETDVGWALFAVVRRYRHLTDDLLTDLPGGPRGYQVLMTAHRGGPRSQAAIASYLGMDRSMMTYLLDDLEDAGLVARRPDPHDRRARRIELTERGLIALDAARQRLHDVEGTLFAPLEPDQQDTLRTLLHRLATSGDLAPLTGPEVEHPPDPTPGGARRARRRRTGAASGN